MGLRGQDDQQEREHMIASEKEEEVEQRLAIFIQVGKEKCLEITLV